MTDPRRDEEARHQEPSLLQKLQAGWREFREEFTEAVKGVHQHIGFGHLLSQFVVGAYLGMHFPFLFMFSHVMRVLTWPWAFAVGLVTGRPTHRVQPHLRFACIIRSMAAFADSSALEPVLRGADARERSALHLMPLLVGAEYGLTTFANVFLLRAPFRLEPSGSKRFRVIVGEGEPLTRMDRAFLLGVVSVLPVGIAVGALLTETGVVS